MLALGIEPSSVGLQPSVVSQTTILAKETTNKSILHEWRWALPRDGSSELPAQTYFFTPYLERAFFRFTPPDSGSTPCESRVPRMTLYLTPGRSGVRPPLRRTIECS